MFVDAKMEYETLQYLPKYCIYLLCSSSSVQYSTYFHFPFISSHLNLMTSALIILPSIFFPFPPHHASPSPSPLSLSFFFSFLFFLSFPPCSCLYSQFLRHHLNSLPFPPLLITIFVCASSSCPTPGGRANLSQLPRAGGASSRPGGTA